MTNPLSIRLFFELIDEDMSVGELSKKLDTPMTSVQNSINRMYTNGILVKYNDPEDSRRTLYRINMIPMFLDANGYNMEHYPLEDCIRDLVTYPKDLMKNFLIIFIKIMSDNGINLWPLLLNVGVFLETSPKSSLKISKDTDRKELIGYRTPYIPYAEFDVSFTDDLVVNIGSDRLKKCDAVFTSVGMGLLIKRMSKLTHEFYSPLVRVEYGPNGNPVRLISKIHRRRSDDVPTMDRYAISSSPGKNQDVFDIYRVGERSYLIKNKLMIDILDTLQESEMDVLGLENRTGKQKVSIYSALSKLESIGAVMPCDPNSKRNKVYRIGCERLFRSQSVPIESEKRNLPGLGDPSLSSDELCVLIYSCVEILFEKMGMSMTDVMISSFEPLKDIARTEFGKLAYQQILDVLNYKNIAKVIVEDKKRKLRPLTKNRENRYMNKIFDYLLEDILN